MSESPAKYRVDPVRSMGQPLFSVEPAPSLGDGLLWLKYAYTRKVWLIRVEDIATLIEAVRPFGGDGSGAA